MRNAECGMGKEKWRMANGRWRMADGGWQMPRQKGPPTFPGCQEVGGPFPLPIVDGRLNSNFLYFGSHGGRRHAGVDGSLNSGFLYFSLPHARPVPVKSWSCTSWFGQWSPDPPSSATAGLPVPDRRR